MFAVRFVGGKIRREFFSGPGIRARWTLSERVASIVSKEVVALAKRK